MDQIISRQLISDQAESAAERSVATGKIEANPYEAGTEAAAHWKASFERWLLAHSAPEAEGSA